MELSMTGSDDAEVSYSQITCKVGIGTLFFPVEKAKTLIQMGYEPMPIFRTRTFLGKPALGLPNIFKYMRHIWRQDGWQGLYGGWTVNVLYQLSQTLVYEHSFRALESQEERELRALVCKQSVQKRQGESAVLSVHQRRRLFVLSTVRDMAGRLLCIVVSQPLFVWRARVIAQLAADETQYSGWMSGLYSIYEESGLSGFLSGLCPRLLAGAATTMLVSAIVYATSGGAASGGDGDGGVLQVLDDVRPYTSPIASFVASTLVYPCQVVATCSAVSGANLTMARPPLMPLYSSWWQCWRDLRARGELKRGASLLSRYYTGPQVTLGGRLIAVD